MVVEELVEVAATTVGQAVVATVVAMVAVAVIVIVVYCAGYIIL